MLHHLAQILVHIGKFLLEWKARSHAVDRVLPGGSPTSCRFEQLMLNLSHEAEVPLAALRQDRATFQPSYKGRSYVTVLLNQGSTIAVGMFSNIRFPPTRVPQKVCDMSRRLVYPCDGFSLVTTGGPEGSYVIADSCVPASELRPAAFIDLTQRMMLVLHILDSSIVELGLATECRGAPT
jgi:hypothetical protein